jgi:NAD(P)-dependent dehydrogenase (short-subunit alcohol dehydrogenase family)
MSKRVIWLSSIAGKQGGGVFGSAHYAASKAAVIGLCQAAARELGAYGITSNAIAPGLVMTGLVAAASSAEREAEIERRVIAVSQSNATNIDGRPGRPDQSRRGRGKPRRYVQLSYLTI